MGADSCDRLNYLIWLPPLSSTKFQFHWKTVCSRMISRLFAFENRNWASALIRNISRQLLVVEARNSAGVSLFKKCSYNFNLQAKKTEMDDISKNYTYRTWCFFITSDGTAAGLKTKFRGLYFIREKYCSDTVFWKGPVRLQLYIIHYFSKWRRPWT